MKQLLLLGLLASTAPAVDLSGTYENSGAAVSTTLAAPEGGVPFRGLTALEFDLPLARALHSDTDRIVVTQADHRFIIRCLDAHGAETWSGRWERSQGYGVKDGQVKLLFRAKRHGEDGFLFTLSPVGEQRLLLVEVERIQTTYFGPVMKSLGSFIFDRVAGDRTDRRR